MKHAVIGLTLAVLAATSTVVSAADPAPTGGAAGTIEKAASFAEGNVATIIAVGTGAAAGIAAYVLGSSDGSTATATTSTATATTR